MNNPSPLFYPPLLNEELEEYIKSQQAQDVRRWWQTKQEMLDGWVTALETGVIHDTNETSLHGAFLQGIFGGVLGYNDLHQSDKNGVWTLSAEKNIRGYYADAALGFFHKDQQRIKTLIPIELKGAKQPLDQRTQTSKSTPVQQGKEYTTLTPESRWFIVSNYRETRLYTKHSTERYETFYLSDLKTIPGRMRFYFLLAREHLLPSTPAACSIVDDLLVRSAQRESLLYSENRRDTVRRRFEMGEGPYPSAALITPNKE